MPFSLLSPLHPVPIVPTTTAAVHRKKGISVKGIAIVMDDDWE
jgi:hypothetical protein